MNVSHLVNKRIKVKTDTGRDDLHGVMMYYYELERCHVSIYERISSGA